MMTKKAAASIVVGCLATWGLALGALGVVPWGALPMLAGLVVLGFGLVALMHLGAGGRLVVLALALLPFASYAQSTTDYDPDALSAQAFDKLALGDYWGAAGLGVMLLTMAIRSGAFRKWPESWLTKQLEDPLVAFTLPIFLSVLVVLIPMLTSGTPFTFSLLAATVVKVSGSASMLFLGFKNALERRDLKAVPDPHATAPGGAP